MLQYPFTLNYLQSLPARARCCLTFTFLSPRMPRALPCSTASQLVGHQPPGYSSPGAGLRTSLCWVSQGSCQPWPLGTPPAVTDLWVFVPLITTLGACHLTSFQSVSLSLPCWTSTTLLLPSSLLLLIPSPGDPGTHRRFSDTLSLLCFICEFLVTTSTSRHVKLTNISIHCYFRHFCCAAAVSPSPISTIYSRVYHGNPLMPAFPIRT